MIRVPLPPFCGFFKAQPEQTHVVRTSLTYRTLPHTAQSHHAERSEKAAKQNRFFAANARPLQLSPLRGRLGGMGESTPPCFWFFWHQKNSVPHPNTYVSGLILTPSWKISKCRCGSSRNSTAAVFPTVPTACPALTCCFSFTKTLLPRFL